VNQPFDPDQFDAIYRRMLKHLDGKELFVQSPYAVADPHYRLPVRIITETAYHSLFTRNMFIGAPAGYKPTSSRSSP
jgi:phosphoenolpyruvate carboxykinase (ATP)